MNRRPFGLSDLMRDKKVSQKNESCSSAETVVGEWPSNVVQRFDEVHVGTVACVHPRVGVGAGLAESRGFYSVKDIA